jgi:hypothetical protein
MMFRVNEHHEVELTPEELEAIKSLLATEIGNSADIYGKSVEADDELRIGAGRDESDLAHEITVKIWKTVGRYVPVAWDSWDLERDPDNGNIYDEDDFNEEFSALDQIAMIGRDDE